MKTVLTFLLASLITNFSFSQPDTIAKWTFPTGDLSDTMPDKASTLNVTKYITTYGGTSNILMKNGSTTKAAQATGWDSGENLKSWQLEVNTTGFEGIKISSKQTAGDNNPGPKNFKLQYKLGVLGTWTDVSGGIVVVANDWSTGVLDNIDLPAGCNNQISMFLRWLMTSNDDINGDTVLSNGAGKIDDIIITGSISTKIIELHTNMDLKIYPNPCQDILQIESGNKIDKISIYSIAGNLLHEFQGPLTNYMVITKSIDQGIYILAIYFANQKEPTFKTLILSKY